MIKRYKTYHVINAFSGKTEKTLDVLQEIKNRMKAGYADSALSQLCGLIKIAKETDDKKLMNDCMALMVKFDSPYRSIPCDREEAKSTIARAIVHEKQIDKERLKTHFKYPFNREGGGINTLINMLKGYHDRKDIAMIAHEIYQSKYFMKGDYKSFSSWYKTFCDIVGTKCCESYKPSKLKLNKEQEASFYFLK